VFVPAKYRGLSLDGDQVSLVTWAGVRGVEGRVEAVLARGRARLTGILRRAGALRMYLEPDDPRIAADYGRVALEGVELGKEGDAVVVEITQYPTLLQQAIAGRVQKVLGDPEDPRTEIEKILAVSSIPLEFPEAVQAQAQATPQALGPEDFADRIDLRSRRFCTIDPETARDFDDALCVEDGPHGGPRVWVAVADVAHYVRWGDALDREAELRGVSVYLPDRVISMLPIQLSAGICSLNPEVDRCAMVVRLDFDPAGGVVEAGLAAAVIRSHARLDYPGVAAALGGDFRGRREAYRPWAAELRRLSELAMKMRARRRARGALELEIGEPKVVLDADDPRLVCDVVRAKGDAAVKGAYELVEEFMIAANEAVGRYFRQRGATTVWRVHAPPKEDRRRSLAELLAAYGIATDADELGTPLGMKHVLDELSQQPAARALSFLVLRTLTQAVWDTVPIGHFGLASGDYLHFTSPIRRYPDLLVHRLLKHYLHKEGQASGGGYHKPPPEAQRLTELAAASSAHERRAMEAERETVSMYRAYMMRDQVGEQFQGVISAVTSFGVFVEIEAPFVEGLIRIDSLADDAYVFDDVHLRLTGRRTGKQLALGDQVTVALRDVSVLRRRIELELVATATARVASAEELAAARKRAPRSASTERPVHGRRGTGPAARRGPARHAETVEVTPAPQVAGSEDSRPRRRPARTEEGWPLPQPGLAAKRQAGRTVAKAAAAGRPGAKAKGGLRLGVSARLTRGPGRGTDEDAPRPRKGKLVKAKGKRR
jgi:ribonuclease R